MNINGLALISIPVKDQEVAKNFYHDVLGFDIARESPYTKEAKWIELRIPGSDTNITLVTWFPTLPSGCMRGIVLLTDDIEGDFQFLQEKGAGVEPIQTAQWGQYLRVFDPDGNGWVIQQKRR